MVWRSAAKVNLCLKVILAGAVAYLLSAQLIHIQAFVLSFWLSQESAILIASLSSYLLFILTFCLGFLVSQLRGLVFLCIATALITGWRVWL